MSTLIETASSWYNGMNSALYSFVSKERVESEQLRQRMLREIESEIADLTTDNYVKTKAFSTEEIESLNELRLFIKSAPIRL